jgi:tetratricopeptide (TPR) repeat protein
LLDKEMVEHPSNLIPVYLENYIDFLTVYIKEEPASFENFRKALDIRMEMVKKGNHDSPWYRYCVGNMRIQFAICRIKFGEYKSAALDIYHAQGELTDNAKKYPGFIIQNSGLGLIQVMAGIIPDNYSWVLKILNMQGDVKKGLDELETVVAYEGKNEIFREFRMEALLYLAFLDATLGQDPKNAIQIVTNLEAGKSTVSEPNNPLLIFVKATILSKAGKTDEAISILKGYHIEQEEFPFRYLDYLTGLNKLNRLDPDACLYFIRFLENFKGRNYIKSAYQKLAWTFLLNGNLSEYKVFIDKVITHGGLFIDTDIQANREAKSKELPNTVLLKARLLCDGGYTNKAMNLLLNQSVKNFIKTPKELLEYNYRLGRIYQQSGNQPEALKYFSQTILAGGSQPWYFAENAALQSGIIYEQNKDFPMAERFFKLCLTMKNTEYKNSLDQKARLELKRIKPNLP